MTLLRPDMKARYKSDPSVVVWLIDVLGENAKCFLDGTVKLVPLSELEPAPDLQETSPDAFRVALTRRRLEYRLTDQLLSYKASRTKLYYHQFLPVKKMLESPDQRLLIADEVGTGKTIEAGLIWAELESRAMHGLENVWIVCPKSLMGKWQDEMRQRFDFQLEILSSDGLRQALATWERDGVLAPRFAKSIVNLELIRLEGYFERLGRTDLTWDFAIFDEAHHLCNPATLSHALAKFICERSNTAVFLTATPLQTSLADIVHLMEALGVDVAEDPVLLEEQLGWDMKLNDWLHAVRHQPLGWQQKMDRSLDRLETEGGRERLGWKQFRQLVAESQLTDRRQRTVAIEAARDLQILSPYMTRTLRSDVDENRPIREAMTRSVQFSPAEAAFYQTVYRICLDRALAKGISPGFVTQMPERRTASCVPAVASEILRYAQEDEDEGYRARFTRAEREALEPLARAALQSRDRKLEALCEILADAFGRLQADRVMIFSSFRGTLHYLKQELGAAGYSLELMYGLTPAREEDCRHGEKSRERIGAEFRQGAFQILLASEVAGEGLDFEHCHVVINYDLPWNPMRVEQRIGRCDRLGQRSDKIHVGNLASIGTIEQRILLRLYERLRIFERSLGDMEIILGEEMATFEKEVFSRDLSPQQQEERLERIGQIIENRERQRADVTRSSVISAQARQLIESERQEVREAEARFLAPGELADFVHASMERDFPDSLRPARSEGIFELNCNDKFREAFQAFARSYPTKHSAKSEILRFHKRMLGRRKMKISFSAGGEEVEFVHFRHPLVLWARHSVRERHFDVPYCLGALPKAMVKEMTVLVWAVGRLEGYTNRAEQLCAVVDCLTASVSPVSVEQAQEWMRSLSAWQREPYAKNDVEMLTTQAEQALMAQFKDVTRTFKTRNDLLGHKAKQAVQSHAERKIRRLQQRLASQADLKNNIRNLYLGWIRRIETESQAKMDEIEKKSQVRSSLQIIGAAVVHPL